MRVTNSMMIDRFLSNLNHNTTTMSAYQDQLASGKRVNRLGDDPIGVMSILDSRAKLSKLSQYNDAISSGTSWLQQAETSMDGINDVLSTAYEKAFQAANGTLSDDDRQSIRALVTELKDHIVQLGNTTFGGRYVFGGYNTTEAPFTVDAGGLKYNGVYISEDTPDAATTAAIGALEGQNIQFSTGTNLSTTVSFNGIELMGAGTNNIFTIFQDMEDALNANDPAALVNIRDRLQNKQQDILSLLADVGGRQNRLEMMTQANDNDNVNYTQALSKVEDIDQAYVTMQFAMAQAVYRSALSVGAKVIQPTLLDFLR